MIDKNKVYRTRDGREVRIYATDGWGSFPVHGAIKTSHGWKTNMWTLEGGSDAYMERDADLIEVRPRHKRLVWLNVYKDHVGISSTKQDADTGASWRFGPEKSERIACLRVELDFEEGEGL